MSQLLIDVSAALAESSMQERESFCAGLYAATQARLCELETTLAEANAHLQRFEQRYGVPFERFEAELLPTLDSPKAHEDYNDWFFWQSVWAEQQALLAKLQQ